MILPRTRAAGPVSEGFSVASTSELQQRATEPSPVAGIGHSFDVGFAACAAVCFLLWDWLLQAGLLVVDLRGRNHYYTAVAISLLHGHLWVPRRFLQNECFIVHHRCYGYYGLAPSILRLPVALFGPKVAYTNATEGFYFDLGWLVIVASAWWCARQLIDLWSPGLGRRAQRIMGALCAAVAGASPLLFLGSRPMVYEEAILWGVAFGSLALGLAISLYLRPRARTAILLILADAGGVLSRPTIGAAGVFATAVLGIMIWRRGRAARQPGALGDPRRQLRWGAVLIVGAVLALASSPISMALKFGTPSPPFRDQLTIGHKPRQLRVYEHPGGFNLAVLPTKVWSTIDPVSLRIFRRPPYIWLGERHPTLVWPAHRSDLDWGPTSGVPPVLPFTTLAVLVGLGVVGAAGVRWYRHRGPDPALAITALTLVSALGAVALDQIFPGQAYRYLADWLPPFFIVAPVGLAVAGARLERASEHRVVLVGAVVTVLVAAQLFAQVGIAVYNNVTAGGERPNGCYTRFDPIGAARSWFCPPAALEPGGPPGGPKA